MVGIAVVALAALPFAYAFSFKNIYWMSREFVSYRVGDALSLLAGNVTHPQPVQGLPTAIVSKAIIYGLAPIYGSDLVTKSGLQVYAGLFYAVIVACLLAAALRGARRGWGATAAVSGFILTPVLAGGLPGSFFFAPEYWLGEYAFLALSFAALVRPLPPDSRSAIAIGVRCQINSDH